ncbi:hypothetical protein DL765_006482 [Monosporascus sp. GIB2]|nr:hypothetical protein DL765_006482 [Monosporascus sp. GIB2]
MSKLSPVEISPLAVRKNVYAYAKDGYAKEPLESWIAGYGEGPIQRLKELNICSTHRRYPGSNIDDAFDQNVLLKAPNDAAQPEGSDAALSSAGGRTSALKWQKFEDDELLREGFCEAVNKGEIVFRIVDKLVERLYSEPMIEDGGCCISRALTAASYPLRGIYYFLRHPSYYPLFLGRLLPLSLLSLLVYFILFTFAFLPQLAFLYIFQGRSAWLNAIVLVLGEGLVIIQGLFEGFFVDECRVDVFDATLIDKGLTDLVAPHRILYPDAANSVKMLGKPSTAAVYQPWSLIQIVELIVFLPLNLIPYVGTPAFIIITGARLGTFAHYRWFKLRGLTRKERKAEIRSRMWEYTWFGTVAMLLELVPILSFLFLLTSTTGAALWTAKLEEQKRTQVAVSGDAAPVSSQGHEPDEPPPPYEDNPV